MLGEGREGRRESTLPSSLILVSIVMLMPTVLSWDSR